MGIYARTAQQALHRAAKAIPLFKLFLKAGQFGLSAIELDGTQRLVSDGLDLLLEAAAALGVAQERVHSLLGERGGRAEQRPCAD